MIARLSLLLVVGVVCGATANAQSQSAAALSAAPRIVAIPLAVPHATPGVIRYRMTATRPGDTARVELGVRTVERHDDTLGGAHVIRSVLSLVSPRGTVVDSTVCHAKSLAPVSERSHQPTKTMALDFAGARITGLVAPKDSAPHSVDMDTTVPVFNSTDADLVVASLPFTEGFHAILPFYTYELGGVERDTVTLLRSEKFMGPDGERKAWVARLDDAFVHITYWIDAGTREIVQAEFVRRKDGVRMRMTRF
jgi:hypothetical protein